MAYCLCGHSEEGKDPQLTDGSMGQLEQEDLPIRKYFTRIDKLSIMGSCHCVESTRGKDPLLTDQSVD